MSTAICITTPLHFTPSDPATQLRLVVDNTTAEPPTPVCAIGATAPKKHTVHTHVLELNVGRPISREDQKRIMDVLETYAEAILAIIFKGSVVQYAVNLCHVAKNRTSYLAGIRADITRAVPRMRSYNTDRELTPEHHEAIKKALQWAKHLITSISFNGKTVNYGISLGGIDEKYRKTVQLAIEGDIFMAARHGHGEWR